KAVLAIQAPVPGKPVGIKAGFGKPRDVGNTEKEVAEIGIGVSAVELKAAIVVFTEEIDVGLGTEAPHVETVFHGVAAPGPTEIVIELEVVIEGERCLGFSEVGSGAGKGDTSKTVVGEGSKSLKSEPLDDLAPVEQVGAGRVVLGQANAELV